MTERLGRRRRTVALGKESQDPDPYLLAGVLFAGAAAAAAVAQALANAAAARQQEAARRRAVRNALHRAYRAVQRFEEVLGSFVRMLDSAGLLQEEFRPGVRLRGGARLMQQYRDMFQSTLDGIKRMNESLIEAASVLDDLPGTPLRQQADEFESLIKHVYLSDKYVSFVQTISIMLTLFKRRLTTMAREAGVRLE